MKLSKSWLSSPVLPFLAVAAIFAAYLFLIKSLVKVLGFGFFNFLTVPRFDAWEYQSLTLHGYSRQDLTWFPLYPLLLRIFMAVSRLSIEVAAPLLSSLLALLATLFLFAYSREILRSGRKALLSVVSLLLFPVSFYYLVSFPYSLLNLLIFSYLWLSQKQKRIGARLVSGLISLTYPSGFLLILFAVVKNWRTERTLFRFGLNSLLDSFFFLTPLLLLFTYFWWRFGDFWAFFHLQSSGFGRHFSLLSIPSLLDDSFAHRTVYSVENLIVLYLLLFLSLFLNRNLPVEFLIYLAAVVFLSLTSGSLTAIYRHFLPLFPLHLYLPAARRPRLVKILFLAVSAYLMKKYLAGYLAGNLI